MKQVLNDILQAEKQANQTIGQARQEASKMRREAEIGISKDKAELKDQVRKIMQGMVEDARQGFWAEVENSDDGTNCLVSDEKHKKALEAIIGLICQPFSEEED